MEKIYFTLDGIKFESELRAERQAKEAERHKRRVRRSVALLSDEQVVRYATSTASDTHRWAAGLEAKRRGLVLPASTDEMTS